MSDTPILPWWTIKKTELFFLTPGWYQKWHNQRSFWKHMESVANGDDTWPSLCGAMAAAELNRRLGDKSLIRHITKMTEK